MRHHPRDIAKALAKEIRKAGKVKILKVTGSDIRQGGRFAGVPLSLPGSTQWDGTAYTVLEVTPKQGESYNVAITVLWAGVGAAGGGEYSGNVHADAPRGVIPLQRVYQQRGEGDGEVLDRFIKLAGSDLRDMLGVSTYARGGKARASTGPRPVSGYAYRNVEDGDWRGSSDDVWETIMYTPTGNEKLLGERYIDGARVRVFRMDDGWYVAQTAVATGGKARKNANAPRCPRCGRKMRRASTGHGWFCTHRRCGEFKSDPPRGGKRRAPGAGLIKAAAALKAAWR